MLRSSVLYVLVPAAIIAASIAIVSTNAVSNYSGVASTDMIPSYEEGPEAHLESKGVLSGTQYRLPLNAPRDIDNWHEIGNARGELIFSIDGEFKKKLESNGFVTVKPHGKPDKIGAMYEALRAAQIPIFITTDSLLHLYHIQFSETLKEIESGYFYADIGELSAKMHQMSLEQHASFSDPALRKAALGNAAFFAVGARLAGAADSFPGLPEQASKLVDDEIGLAEKASGLSASPLFGYDLDYSQFVPRGHYTQSEELGRYFKAMIWYGNAAFFAKSDAQTVQAVLIADMLLGTPELQEKWDRIYTVTSFYVGKSDDLGPSDYLSAYRSAGLGGYGELAGEQGMGALKAELAKAASPKIHGGTGVCKVEEEWTPDLAKQCLDDQAGMRFMGQRFTPDSYIFSSLVDLHYTGNETPFTMSSAAGWPTRGFPMGLDVMYVLGSDRAGQILQESGDADYAGYAERVGALRTEFAALTEDDWSQSLYYGWMHALSALLEEPPARYPTFMQGGAWQDKHLNTALASWSELRHDTILYAKQSYSSYRTGASSEPALPKVAGYVEPALEFYQRLYGLTDETESGLQEFGLLEGNGAKKIAALKTVLARLMDITEKELENEPLTPRHYDYINDFADHASSITRGKDGDKSTILVADVHTNPSTGQVLEEATGPVDLIVVAYKLPDGRILAGVGPTLSYYEFKHPSDDRLTDEKWSQMVINSPQPRPEWTSSFRADP